MGAEEAIIDRGADIANRWPMVVLMGLVCGAVGWFFYVQSINADRREAQMIASNAARESELMALANRFAEHITAQNRTMTTMLEHCVVVSPEKLKAPQSP